MEMLPSLGLYKAKQLNWSHPRCLVTCKPSFRRSVSAAWSWWYFHKRRDLDHFVQLARQLVGLTFTPWITALASRAGNNWMLRPHIDTGAELLNVSFTLSTVGLYVAGGHPGLAQACTYYWVIYVGNPWELITFLLWNLAFHNYSCVSIIIPNYLTYSLKIESSLKVLAAQTNREASQDSEPGCWARWQGLKLDTKVLTVQKPMTLLFYPHDGNRNTIKFSVPKLETKVNLEFCLHHAPIHTFIHSISIQCLLTGRNLLCLPSRSLSPLAICSVARRLTSIATSPSSLALWLSDGLG